MSELTAETLIEKKSYGVITLEWLKRYAQASGDHNPIHQDEEVARRMGLPGVIAHGMLISGLVHSRATEFLSGHPQLSSWRMVGSTTRFKAMTRLGDEVSVGGTWQIIEPNRISLELIAENQTGEALVTAKVYIESGPRPS